MNNNGRVPPRFVPTLTTVVDLESPPEDSPAIPEPEPTPPEAVGQESEPASQQENSAVDPAGDEGTPTPDESETVAIANPVPSAVSQVAVGPLSEAAAFEIEEDLLHRILQRVDFSLEERLTDVVSQAVQQQLDAMVPRLRTEIENVLRLLVTESLAQELSDNTGSTLGSVRSGLE